MSKAIVIEEGGTSKLMTVDKLKTSLQSGGNCLWVPEDEVQLGIKEIRQSGTYKATSDGLYGYSEVRVNIKGVGTATGRDNDGDEVVAFTGGGGQIEIEKVPSSIEVTTFPDVRAYGEGAYISYQGMVVQAFLASGELYNTSKYPNGVIPHTELVMPETVPYIGGSGGVEALFDACMELTPGEKVYFRMPIPGYSDPDGNAYQINVANIPIYVCIVEDNGGYYGAVFSSQQCDVQYECETWAYPMRYTTQYDSFLNCYVFYDTSRIAPNRSYHSSAYPTINIADIPLLARGDIEYIPIQWDRPKDGETLEAGFPITIIHAGGHGDD